MSRRQMPRAGLVLQLLSPSANARAIVLGLRLLRAHPRLIIEMAREDLAARYRGQILGSAWILIHPLAITLLYLFIFGVVFAQRSVGGTREMPLDYTAYILSGLIPWLTYQLVLTSSASSITSNASLVKQFTFPIEVLPIRDVATSTVTWFVGMAGVLLHVMFSLHVVHWMWLLLPALFILQLLGMIGTALLMSTVAVFFRDLKDIINLFCLIAMFLMPIVYLPSWVPPIFRPVLWINPFSYMVWVFQDAIYFGRFEHPLAWVIFPVTAVFAFSIGVRAFMAAKPIFSSVL